MKRILIATIAFATVMAVPLMAGAAEEGGELEPIPLCSEESETPCPTSTTEPPDETTTTTTNAPTTTTTQPPDEATTTTVAPTTTSSTTTTTPPEELILEIALEVDCLNRDAVTDKREPIIYDISGTYTEGSTDEFDLEVVVEMPPGTPLGTFHPVGLPSKGLHDGWFGDTPINDTIKAFVLIDGELHGDIVIVDCFEETAETTATSHVDPEPTLPVTGMDLGDAGIGGTIILLLGGATVSFMWLTRPRDEEELPFSPIS